MLARSRDLLLSNGVSVQTPVLVPSLSSKGFAPVLVDGEEVPAPAFFLETFSQWLRPALLVSAYDLHHRQLADVDVLFEDFDKSLYAQPEFLIIDSGLYEFRPGADLGEIYAPADSSAPWSEELLRKTLERLPGGARAAVVNWDSYRSYAEQIEQGRQFFERESVERFASILLLKPEPSTDVHEFGRLAPDAARLQYFDAVGVTEKELGESIADRLQRLANLRRLLDRSECDRPIHVFGGLDPLFSPLYFAAGAEIFDGLSWLRYAYVGGMSAYREAGVLFSGEYHERLLRALLRQQLRNVELLRSLTADLRLYAERGTWTHFEQGRALEEAAKALIQEEDQ